jgi:hypothetical protein
MLLPFFEWCEATWIGQTIRDSLWLFPVIEAVHLLALAALGGAVFIVDFRLLGIGLRQPVREIARDAQHWMNVSLPVILMTGVALFLSEAVKCYYNPSFWVKMTALPLAILFTLTIKRRITRRKDDDIPRMTGTLVALTSIGLWLVTAAAGRWIGFSS